MTSLKMMREALCVAQNAILNLPSYSEHAKTHAATLQSMIDEIDVHRPLGPDGKHGELHTLTCGCEDAPKAATIAAPDGYSAPTDWARHELDTTDYAAPLNHPWPRWAGAEPVDPPDPQCVCGAPWDTENNFCPIEAAVRARLAVELAERDGPVLIAAQDVVTAIRGLRGLSQEALQLIDVWDRRAEGLTAGDTQFGYVPRAVADMLEQAWNIIANVGVHVHTGGWDAQHPSWVDAAKRWRDECYHPWLDHYCRNQPGHRPPAGMPLGAWGRARWLHQPGAGVHPQMVTGPRSATIHMVVRKSGIHSVYTDVEVADQVAANLNAVVIEIPIKIDYRRAEGW